MFNKENIEQGLMRLGEIAEAEGMVVDISVYGGSALVVAWNCRVGTKDVDAVIHGDPQFLRKACKAYIQVAQENGWSDE